MTTPDVAERWWVALMSTPTGILPMPEACRPDPIEPSVSASTTDAPPWRRPKGWVLPSTGMVATTRSIESSTISTPIFSLSLPAPSGSRAR